MVIPWFELGLEALVASLEDERHDLGPRLAVGVQSGRAEAGVVVSVGTVWPTEEEFYEDISLGWRIRPGVHAA